MKTEKVIRNRLNKLVVDFFKGKFNGQEKKLVEEEIRCLVWVLDECILVDGEKVKLAGKGKK